MSCTRRPYADGPEPRPVTGRHVLVHCMDGIRAAHFPVLFVHVVRARAGIIAEPDAKVLDLERALFMDLALLVQAHSQLFFRIYLIKADNLAIGLLDLAELHQEVPESRLRDDRVGREDPHAVQLRGRVCLRRQMAPDDLVLRVAACVSSEPRRQKFTRKSP